MFEGHILVVDDEPVIVGGLGPRLGAEGHRISNAMERHSATTTVTAEQSDLCILDIRKPAGNGHVVVEHPSDTD